MKGSALFIIGLLLLLSSAANAQVSLSINAGSPPLWGPPGYGHVRYYYLPDVESYYDTQSSMFIYPSNGTWIRRAYLPRRYKSYDLYSGYKVVMTDYHGDSPYSNFKEYKVKYKKGYHDGQQKTIGNRPGKGNSGHHSNEGKKQGHSKEKGNKKKY